MKGWFMVHLLLFPAYSTTVQVYAITWRLSVDILREYSVGILKEGLRGLQWHDECMVWLIWMFVVACLLPPNPLALVVTARGAWTTTRIRYRERCATWPFVVCRFSTWDNSKSTPCQRLFWNPSSCTRRLPDSWPSLRILAKWPRERWGRDCGCKRFRKSQTLRLLRRMVPGYGGDTDERTWNSVNTFKFMKV